MAREEEVLEEVKEPEVDGFIGGVVFLTTLVLIAAFIMVELALKEYGIGIFKGQ